MKSYLRTFFEVAQLERCKATQGVEELFLRKDLDAIASISFREYYNILERI